MKGRRKEPRDVVDLVVATACVQVAVVKLNRASRALRTSYPGPKPQLPEYYEANRALILLEELQRHIGARARGSS